MHIVIVVAHLIVCYFASQQFANFAKASSLQSVACVVPRFNCALCVCIRESCWAIPSTCFGETVEQMDRRLSDRTPYFNQSMTRFVVNVFCGYRIGFSCETKELLLLKQLNFCGTTMVIHYSLPRTNTLCLPVGRNWSV